MAGAKAQAGLDQLVVLAMRCECEHLEAVGVAPNNVQGALADRSGRPKNGDALHCVFSLEKCGPEEHERQSRCGASV